jgi:DMSO/TMAO reductase YedYZ molybdopterin-dependent catalytic subunit
MRSGSAFRLEVRGGARELRLSRQDLLRLPQHTHSLPIACVEGWSTTQSWSGVPLAALARLAGAEDAGALRVESLQPAGVLRAASLSRDQFLDERSLLALSVNGAALSLDHGFPARVIVPALPGVHNTKWVGVLSFQGAA